MQIVLAGVPTRRTVFGAGCDENEEVDPELAGIQCACHAQPPARVWPPQCAHPSPQPCRPSCAPRMLTDGTRRTAVSGLAIAIMFGSAYDPGFYRYLLGELRMRVSGFYCQMLAVLNAGVRAVSGRVPYCARHDRLGYMYTSTVPGCGVKFGTCVRAHCLV